MIVIEHLSGVVTFPSFHAVMACMIGSAFQGFRWMSALVWIWSSVMVFSAIPIGGHYAIDLVAGAALWAIFALLIQVGLPRSIKIAITLAAFQ